jgi:hypothetical protein
MLLLVLFNSTTVCLDVGPLDQIRVSCLASITGSGTVLSPNSGRYY